MRRSSRYASSVRPRERLHPAASHLAPTFKALSEPIRLRLLPLIASTTEACVCDLTDAFEVTGAIISHHLRVLRETGLVDCERRGTWVYYWLRKEALDNLGSLLLAVRQAGQDRVANAENVTQGAARTPEPCDLWSTGTCPITPGSAILSTPQGVHPAPCDALRLLWAPLVPYPLGQVAWHDNFDWAAGRAEAVDHRRVLGLRSQPTGRRLHGGPLRGAGHGWP